MITQIDVNPLLRDSDFRNNLIRSTHMNDINTRDMLVNLIMGGSNRHSNRHIRLYGTINNELRNRFNINMIIVKQPIQYFPLKFQPI